MPYVDAVYYLTEYGGTTIPETDLERFLKRANDQVDSMTYNRIVSVGFDQLTDFQQERVKQAVCAQADFIAQYGDFTDVPLQGFSAGKISMSFTGEQINGVATSRTVRSYLDQTGLTSRRL